MIRAYGRASWSRYHALWSRQTLRVKVLLTLAGPALVLALFDVLWYAPHARQLATQQAALVRAQSRARELVANLDAARSAHERVALRTAPLRQEIARTTAALQALRSAAVPPEAMRARLTRLVAQTGPAALVGVETGTPVQVPQESVYRHPLVLSLEGGFDTLLTAVKAMEADVHALRWSAIDLQVREYPRVLGRFEVYTVSDQSTWMRL